jgi:hypothetical protein
MARGSSGVIVAAILAGIGGLATGVGGALWVDAKAWIQTFNRDKWNAYITEPKSRDCDVYKIYDIQTNPVTRVSVLGPAGTEIFEWQWDIGESLGRWAGTAIKHVNSNIKYDLQGISLAGRLVLLYSSATKLEGLGAYLLVHHDDDGNGNEIYTGNWIGRDCSITTHPYVLCSMIVTHLSMDVSQKLHPLAPGCSLVEP